MRRISLPLVAVIVIALLIVTAIAGTVVYYQSQIASLNTQIIQDNRQISNLAAQVGNLKNMTKANEELTFTNFKGGTFGVGGCNVWNWTFTFELKNTGNATAIINNVILPNGQSYSSFNPAPTVTPSIENGYVLESNQSVTLTLQDTNSTSNPSNGNYIYVMTATGNSYRSPNLGS